MARRRRRMTRRVRARARLCVRVRASAACVRVPSCVWCRAACHPWPAAVRRRGEWRCRGRGGDGFVKCGGVGADLCLCVCTCVCSYVCVRACVSVNVYVRGVVMRRVVWCVRAASWRVPTRLQLRGEEGHAPARCLQVPPKLRPVNDARARPRMPARVLVVRARDHLSHRARNMSDSQPRCVAYIQWRKECSRDVPKTMQNDMHSPHAHSHVRNRHDTPNTLPHTWGTLCHMQAHPAHTAPRTPVAARPPSRTRRPAARSQS